MNLRDVEFFSFFFLSAYSVFYILRFMAVRLIAAFIWNHPISYVLFFFGLKILPWILLCFYLYKRLWNNGVSKLLEYVTLGLLCFTVFLLFYSFLSPFNNSVMGFEWTSIAQMQWCLSILILFVLFFHKTLSFTVSFTFAYLLTAFGGLLYELPLYVAKNMRINHVHWSHPFLVATDYLLPLMLGFMLFNLSWKPRRLFKLGLVAYVVFSICYGLFQRGMPAVWLSLFARPVTILFLCMIPLEVRA